MAAKSSVSGAIPGGAAFDPGSVGKLGAIVAGDCLEDLAEGVAEAPLQIVESVHHAGGTLVHKMPDDLFPRQSLGEDEQHLVTRAGDHYCVHFQVSKGVALLDFLRALFYALTAWRHLAVFTL